MQITKMKKVTKDLKRRKTAGIGALQNEVWIYTVQKRNVRGKKKFGTYV